MKSFAKKDIYGLFGRRLTHSFSPLMHNGFFKKHKVKAEYFLFEIEPKNLKRATLALAALGIKGVNVTFPYKEKVIPFLDKLSPEAEQIGAVNTIKVKNGKLLGFNTDGEGFIRSLKEKFNFNPQGKNCLLVGAGGAARAVGVYLAREKINFLGIYDIKRSKAENLSRHLRRFFPQAKIESLKTQKNNLLPLDLIINATPLGLHPNDALAVNPALIRKGIVIYDLVYNPLTTKLLKLAARKKAKPASGLWMLIYQGLRSLEIWREEDLSGEEKTLYRAIISYVRK